MTSFDFTMPSLELSPLWDIIPSDELSYILNSKNEYKILFWKLFQNDIRDAIFLFPRLLSFVILGFIYGIVFLQLIYLMKKLILFLVKQYQHYISLRYYNNRHQHIQVCFACGHFQWVYNTIFPYPQSSTLPQSTPNISNLVFFASTPYGYENTTLYDPTCVLAVPKSSHLLPDEQSILYHPSNQQDQSLSDQLHQQLDKSYDQFILKLKSNTTFQPPFHFTVPFVCCYSDCSQLNGAIDIHTMPKQISFLRQAVPQQPQPTTPPQLQQSQLQHRPKQLQSFQQHIVNKVNQSILSTILPPNAPKLCSTCIDDQQFYLSQKILKEKTWYQEQVRRFLKQHLQSPVISSHKHKSDPNMRDQIHTHLKRRHISLRDIIPKIDEDIDELIELIDLPLWMLPPPPTSSSSTTSHTKHSVLSTLDEDDINPLPQQSLDFSTDFTLCRKCEESLQKFNLLMIEYTRQIHDLNKKLHSSSQVHSNLLIPEQLTSNPTFPALNRTTSSSSSSPTNSLITPFRRKRLERGLDQLFPLRTVDHIAQLPFQQLQQPAPFSQNHSPITQLRLQRSQSLNTCDERKHRIDLNNSVQLSPSSIQSPLDLDLASISSLKSSIQPPSYLLSRESTQHTQNISDYNEKMDYYKIQLPILAQFSFLNRLFFHITLLITSISLEPFKFVIFLFAHPFLFLFKELFGYTNTLRDSLSSPSNPSMISLLTSQDEYNQFYNPSQSTSPNLNKQHIQTEKASYLIQYHSILSIISEYQNQNNVVPPSTQSEQLQPDLVHQMFQRYNYLDRWNGFEPDSRQPEPTHPSFPLPSTLQNTLSREHSHISQPAQQQQPLHPSKIAPRQYIEMIRTTLDTFNLPLRVFHQSMNVSIWVAAFYYFLAYLSTMGSSIIFYGIKSSPLTSYISSSAVANVQNLLNIQPRLIQHFFQTGQPELVFHYYVYEILIFYCSFIVVLSTLLIGCIGAQIMLACTDSFLTFSFFCSKLFCLGIGTIIRVFKRGVNSIFNFVFRLCSTIFSSSSPESSQLFNHQIRQQIVSQMPSSAQFHDCPIIHSSPLLSHVNCDELPAPLNLATDDAFQSLSSGSHDHPSSRLDTIHEILAPISTITPPTALTLPHLDTNSDSEDELHLNQSHIHNLTLEPSQQPTQISTRQFQNSPINQPPPSQLHQPQQLHQPPQQLQQSQLNRQQQEFNQQPSLFHTSSQYSQHQYSQHQYQQERQHQYQQPQYQQQQPQYQQQQPQYQQQQPPQQHLQHQEQHFSQPQAYRSPLSFDSNQHSTFANANPNSIANNNFNSNNSTYHQPPQHFQQNQQPQPSHVQHSTPQNQPHQTLDPTQRLDFDTTFDISHHGGLDLPMENLSLSLSSHRRNRQYTSNNNHDISLNNATTNGHQDQIRFPSRQSLGSRSNANTPPQFQQHSSAMGDF